MPAGAGTALVSGAADVSARGGAGGSVNVLGDKVGLLSAKVEASGPTAGERCGSGEITEARELCRMQQ